MTVGDVAPPLHIGRWLRGAPVKRFERGTVYVLDFWAPWCAPCVALMPHLSSIQDELAPRGVRIIAVVGPDTAGTTLDAVESFLARKRDQVRMTIAYDALEERAEPALDVFKGRTTATYLESAKLDGIPIAFVIDGTGRVAWIGQPPELPAILHAVVSGKWDLARAADRYRAARTAEPRLEDLRAHLSEGRVPEAMAEARALVGGPFASESGHLRALASAMAASAQQGSKGVDLDLALAAIRRAEGLSEGADPTVLVTLARVRFLRGEIEQAIDAQQRAIRLCEPPLRGTLEKVLEEYLRARPPAPP